MTNILHDVQYNVKKNGLANIQETRGVDVKYPPLGEGIPVSFNTLIYVVHE